MANLKAVGEQMMNIRRAMVSPRCRLLLAAAAGALLAGCAVAPAEPYAFGEPVITGAGVYGGAYVPYYGAGYYAGSGYYFYPYGQPVWTLGVTGRVGGGGRAPHGRPDGRHRPGATGAGSSGHGHWQGRGGAVRRGAATGDHGRGEDAGGATGHRGMRGGGSWQRGAGSGHRSGR